jgi:COMPASS component SWD3
VATLPAHSDPVTSVVFNYDGTCIASASHDGLARIWDVSTGECLKTVVGEESSEGVAVGCAEFSPNGKYLLSGTLDGRVRLWDLVGGKWSEDRSKRRGKCLKTYCAHTNTRFCMFSTFSTVNPQRNLVISGSEDGKVYLYDLQSRMVRQTLDGHDGDAVLAVGAHDQLELIGSGGMTKDKTVRFWKAGNEDDSE